MSSFLLKPFYLILTVLIFAQMANADDNLKQDFVVSNNSIIKAFASKDEITRLAFQSAVKDVHGIENELDYNVNGKDIFLKIGNSEKPINFFVKTEDEMIYEIILSAKDMPAAQIFIKKQFVTTNSSSQERYSNGVSLELKNRIGKIIEIALSPQKHLGFTIHKKSQNLPSRDKNLDLNLVGEIFGEMLTAQKINIANDTDFTKHLYAEDFMGADDLAVYLTKAKLLPYEECILVRIKDRG